jgi:hypothetical protein
MAIRFIIFLLAFTVEVKVHAARVSLPSVKAPVQEPSECLKTSNVCAIKTPELGKFSLDVGNGKVTLDSNTIVVRVSPTEVKLITGTLWVKSESEIKIDTSFGLVSSSGGEFWVRIDVDKTVVSAIEGTLSLVGKDKKTVLRLEEGEENWIGGIARNGKSTSGVPKAIAFEDHLFRWARLYSGSKTQFEADVKKFHSRWSRQLASVADYHKQLAESRLEVLDREYEKRAQAKAQEESRSKELRSLFRRKQLFQ